MVWGGQIGGVEALGARFALRLSVYTPEGHPRLKSKVFAGLTKEGGGVAPVPPMVDFVSQIK